MRAYAIVAAGFLAWLLPSGVQVAAASGAKPELLIEIEEPLGLERGSWPASVGIPFPRGAHKDTTRLRLQLDGSKTSPIPVQTRVLSRWPDGSVRWMLLDWQADLEARQKRRYRLSSGAAPQPPRALKVTERESAVSIDTGPLRFTIPKTRFAIVDDVHLDGKKAITGTASSFMNIEGERYEAKPPASVKVLDPGPLRARVELRGEYGTDLHYVVRVDAFAGQPFVRVFHSFEQRGTKPFTSVQQIGVEVPLQGTASPTYRAGREQDEPLAGPLGEMPVIVFQEDNKTLRLNGSVQDGRSAGWVDVHDKSRGIALASRFFWQEYPQSFHLGAQKLIYNLWAPEAPAAAIGLGAAKTHEFTIYFSGGKPAPAEQLAVLAEPLVAHVQPEWVVASRALPNSIAPTAATASFIAELRAGFDRYQERAGREVWDAGGGLDCRGTPEHRRYGFYGMLNWGDWNFPWYRDNVKGCETWGNLEYDTTQVLALAFAATGDRDFHTAMTAAARHFMDVDRIHHGPPDCDCTGMTHPRVALHFSFELGGVDLGYAWTEGLVSYFYMTGDERSLDAVRGIADYLVRRLGDDDLTATPRQWGWPQIALIAAYEATGNAAYKTAAREYARRSMAAYPPSSGKDLGVGTLAEALSYVHAETQDPAIGDWLIRHATGVMASPPGVAPRYLPAVAYVGRITKNEDFKREAAAGVPRQGFGDWGKPFTIAGRLGFRILSLVQ